MMEKCPGALELHQHLHCVAAQPAGNSIEDVAPREAEKQPWKPVCPVLQQLVAGAEALIKHRRALYVHVAMAKGATFSEAPGEGLGLGVLPGEAVADPPAQAQDRCTLPAMPGAPGSAPPAAPASPATFAAPPPQKVLPPPPGSPRVFPPKQPPPPP